MSKDPLSRRSFLQNSSASLAMAALAGGAVGARAADAGWKLRLSGSSINLMRLPVEEACARLAKLGVEAVDIWGPHSGCKHLDQVVERLGGSGLKDLLTKHKLKLCGFSVYAGGFEKYAELLGAAGGGIAIRGSTRPAGDAGLTAATKKFLDQLKPLTELAEKHNSYLAIENHGNALLHTLDSFKAFVDENRHPRVGIALAPYHLQSIKASVEEAIAIAGKQLLFFYAWQNAPGTKQLPGEGPADFTPWLAALAKIGYPHYVNPFMHHEPEPDEMTERLAKSIAYLHECRAKLKKA